MSKGFFCQGFHGALEPVTEYHIFSINRQISVGEISDGEILGAIGMAGVYGIFQCTQSGYNGFRACRKRRRRAQAMFCGQHGKIY